MVFGLAWVQDFVTQDHWVAVQHRDRQDTPHLHVTEYDMQAKCTHQAHTDKKEMQAPTCMHI